MMFMRHISLCIILQLVHTENCADLKNVEFAGSIINKRFLFISFKMQFSEEKKAPLDSVGRKVKKKRFFFLGSGPKIGSVGTWETDNQLDVPLSSVTEIERCKISFCSFFDNFFSGLNMSLELRCHSYLMT